MERKDIKGYTSHLITDHSVRFIKETTVVADKHLNRTEEMKAAIEKW